MAVPHGHDRRRGRSRSMNAKRFPILFAIILPAVLLTTTDVSWGAQGQDRKIDAATGEEVGVSSRDGITISGTDVMVTRNGRTETLEAELSLSGGVRIAPDGTITFPGGKT